MTFRDELALHADRLRLQHLARHGIPTPLPWHHLKPSEQQQWLTRAEDDLTAQQRHLEEAA